MQKPTVIKRKAANGGWQEYKRITVNNLGWLFKNQKRITELHFDSKIEKHFGHDWADWELRAILMTGEIFICPFVSRQVFINQFNRKHSLKGLTVFFDGIPQAIGDLV